MPAAARPAAAIVVAVVFSVAPLLACSQSSLVAARCGDALTPGTTYLADLDGDTVYEHIFVERTDAALVITDGEITYRSRERWQVVEAAVGDTDCDGLLEVVTLLDAEDGRHLGLFAFFGGEYRERLVTSELTPFPVTLKVVPAPEGGNLVVLTEEASVGGTGVQTTTYRWNGFGFTAVD